MIKIICCLSIIIIWTSKIMVQPLSAQNQTKEEFKLVLPSKHNSKVFDIILDKTHSFLLSFSSTQVKIHDYKSMKLLYSITDFEGEIISLKISPCSNFFSVVSDSSLDDFRLYLYDINKGRQIYATKSLKSAESIVWDEKRNELMYLDNSGYLKVFNLETSRIDFSVKLKDFNVNENFIGLGPYLDDTNFLCIANNSIYLIDLKSKTSKKILRHKNAAIRNFILSSNKSFLIFTDERTSIYFLNLKNFKLSTLNKRNDDFNYIFRLWLSPTEDYFVNSFTKSKNMRSETYLEIYSLKKIKKVWSSKKNFNRLSFVPDGSGIYFNEDNVKDGFSVQKINFKDFSQNCIIRDNYESIEAMLTDSIRSVLIYGDFLGYINTLPLNNNSIVRNLREELIPIWSLDLSPDGSQMAYYYNLNPKEYMLGKPAFDEQGIDIIDTKSGLKLKTIKVKNINISDLKYSKDGEKLILSSFDNQVRVYDVNTSEQLLSINEYQTKREVTEAISDKAKRLLPVNYIEMNSYGFSSDLKYIAIAYNNFVNIHESDSSNFFRQIKFSKDIKQAVLHPNKNLLYVITDSVFILDIENGSCRNPDIKIKRKYLNQDSEIRFSKNANYFALLHSDGSEIGIYDALTNLKIDSVKKNFEYFVSYQFSPDEKSIIFTEDRNRIVKYDFNTRTKVEIETEHAERILDFKFSKDGRYMVTYSNDIVVLWDYSVMKPVYKRITFLNDNWLVKIPQSLYYMCSREVGKMIHYVNSKMQVVGFEQLDPVYNRPDIVLDSIGNSFNGADQDLIRNYRNAWNRRIDQLGLDQEKLGKGEISVPNVEILNINMIPYENKIGYVVLNISSNDSKYKLQRYNVYVNEVPVYGSNGISISELNTNNFYKSDTIYLSAAENKIQVAVMNELGLENFKYPIYVKYESIDKKVPKTHFIGIGVNQFIESEYNLNYCVKDIQDLAKEMEGENTSVKLFTELDAKRTNILEIKKYLRDSTTIDDWVIIACSSHGLLDDSLNFYLATQDVDFRKPKENGVKYEELEALLDSIPARKKLLMLDACNSGENDRSETHPNNNTVRDSLLKIENYSVKGNIGRKVNVEKFKKISELFVNIRNKTGSFIISAAGGQESALESLSVDGNIIENGTFTYAVLEYLRKNKSEGKKTSVNSLKKYVEQRVIELTKGNQNPTSRQETMDVDWYLP